MVPMPVSCLSSSVSLFFPIFFFFFWKTPKGILVRELQKYPRIFVICWKFFTFWKLRSSSYITRSLTTHLYIDECMCCHEVIFLYTRAPLTLMSFECFLWEFNLRLCVERQGPLPCVLSMQFHDLITVILIKLKIASLNTTHVNNMLEVKSRGWLLLLLCHSQVDLFIAPILEVCELHLLGCEHNMDLAVCSNFQL